MITLDEMPLFLWVVFISIFLVTLVSIILIRRFWTIRFGVDRADGVRKIQSGPVLRVGGLALALAFAACLFASTYLPETAATASVGISFALLGFILFLIGFIDDLFGVSALLKFSGQVTVGVGAYLSGLSIETISNPIGDGWIELGGFGLIVTVLWFVAIPNLINLIDGMDGLAGGVGLFLSLTLGVIGLISGDLFLATMGVGFAGGLTAFLAFNFPPAKIYMGDGGAYLIGYFIAGTSLITSNKGSISGPLLVVTLGLGFPILDTGLTIIRRIVSGMPVMGADAWHLHHRLMTLGFSKRTILLILYGAFATLALLGIAVFLTQGYALPIVATTLILGVFLGLKILGLPHNFNEAKMLFRDMIAVRKDVRFAYGLAQVLEYEFERVLGAEVYWRELINSLARLGITPAFENLGKWECNSSGQCIILFPISENQIWHLCCPIPKRSRRQWDQVVRCFHLTVINGMDKWGPPPSELGIRKINSGKCPSTYEDEINRQLDEH